MRGRFWLLGAVLLFLPYIACGCGPEPSPASVAPTDMSLAITPPSTVPPASTLVPTPTETLTPTPTQTPSATTARTLTPEPRPTATQTPTPELTPRDTRTPTTEPTPVPYQGAFGIDYTQPDRYLDQGQQSHISDPGVLDPLRSDARSLANLGEIYRWLKREFTAYAAGGKTIGVVTVDELLAERRLGGCHDHGLVYAAVARELGYPALMARTVSIAWVERFQAGEPGPHVGHVFAEVYLDGRWLLIDSTNGWYVERGYDPAAPVIPLRGSIAGSSKEVYGFYVERKGIDTWAFGIHSPAESMQSMDDLAGQLDLAALDYPEYDFGHFSRD
jgi:hypothetical protein